ncbi:MAG: type III-A CRISPR-associated RAMP protein Csm3 [Syntrophobacteraceae bacterium]|nr:type III-A CRISPR-associated RAMP protein Csm3 [Syntrophobacteraceae bacterium]
MGRLLGKVIVTGNVKALTGMRIGGSSGGLKIGGVDLNVITDPFGTPYIPGSSLKGKTRSIMERYHSRTLHGGVHLCRTDSEYNECPVCRVWGTMAGAQAMTASTITRLLVSDVFLDKESINQEMRDNLELRWTEVKFETAINRVTGTALKGSLRQIERVPAGAVFKDMHMIFNVFEDKDKDLLKELFIALELLEHDYLGGMGSRGYGRVGFEDMRVFWNSRRAYETGDIALEPSRAVNGEAATPPRLVQDFETIKKGLS